MNKKYLYLIGKIMQILGILLGIFFVLIFILTGGMAIITISEASWPLPVLAVLFFGGAILVGLGDPKPKNHN